MYTNFRFNGNNYTPFPLCKGIIPETKYQPFGNYPELNNTLFSGGAGMEEPPALSIFSQMQ